MGALFELDKLFAEDRGMSSDPWSVIRMIVGSSDSRQIVHEGGYKGYLRKAEYLRVRLFR